ncbi:MAG TPA: endonuclease/exonuclease/phosphatase family protein [Pirellulales bacterium]
MASLPAFLRRPAVVLVAFVAGVALGLSFANVREADRPTVPAPPPAAGGRPSSSPTKSSDVRLRVATFNVEVFLAPGVVGSTQLKRFEDDAARLAHAERIAAVIETLRPDVINLCEVITKESVELLVKILHEKGLTEYQGFHIENFDTFTGEDVAFLSRYPPDVVDGTAIRTIFSRGADSPWREKYSFEANGRTETKTASLTRNAVYYFTINGRKLGFFGLHLKAKPDDVESNAQRGAQAAVARRVIQQEIVARGYWPIVLGDLNDYDPDLEDRDATRNTQTQVLATLKDYDSTQPGAELMNVAERQPRVFDRHTNYWDFNNNNVVDPGDVNTMLDHILIPRECAGAIERAFISHSVPPDTTDHSPVVVDLNLAAFPSDAPPAWQPANSRP